MSNAALRWDTRAPRTPVAAVDTRKLVNIVAGDWIVTREDVVLTTVLGSCVAAYVRDVSAGLNGLNHFLLPDSRNMAYAEVRRPTMFGDHAMEQLVEALLAQGARMSRIEVKLFGGACMYESANDIGASNAKWAMQYVRDSGLRLNFLESDLCGTKSRRIQCCTRTGAVTQQRS